MGRLWQTIGGKRKRTQAGVAHEYEKFQSSAKAKADRASRNSARRSALKKGLVHKGDGQDVDHRNSNPRDNRSSNLRIISASENRGKAENSRLKRSGRKKNRGRYAE